MRTMPESYLVSGGAWHRLLLNRTGKDGRWAFFNLKDIKEVDFNLFDGFAFLKKN